MASGKGSSGNLQMKLLVDTKNKRVLYGEAGKDVVDFLFSLLTLPVGTIVKFLTTDSMVGSIGNLYGSVVKLDDTYICSDGAKAALLTPSGGCGTGKLLQLSAVSSDSGSIYRCDSDINQYPSCRTYVTNVFGTQCPSCLKGMVILYTPPKFVPKGGAGSNYTVMDELTAPLPASGRLYWCNSTCTYNYPDCRTYVTKGYGTRCPSCGNGMYANYKPLEFVPKVEAGSVIVGGGGGATGFVQGVMTYTVMDDLMVAPMSTISGITLLNTFGITDIGSLQEKTVQLGYTEGLEILKMSLQSKKVLTDVFIGKKTKA